MKIKRFGMFLFGAFTAAISLQASNPCPGGGLTCIEIANGNNALTGNPISITTQTGETVDLSPYTGTLSQTVGATTTSSAITLYCDDLNNLISTGQQYNMNVTRLTPGASLANTQFDTANPAGSSGNLPGTSIPIPTGTTLYDEEAWLYTQMMDLSGGNLSSANITALQEAAWELTSNNLTSAEENNANAWLTAAYNAVVNNQTAGSVNGIAFQAASYSAWYVYTDPASADDASSTGYQEFLAYSGGGGGQGVITNGLGTPEPSTFWLFGIALVAGAFLTRGKAFGKPKVV